jgi:LPS O-antigen subunit length determinant protein (WzzB/FepE family)
MSGTETILLIVLGFTLASLVGLFMARMIWTAAVKVGVRRMQRQVPSSLVGLQTERDRLRAEFAMLAQRLGARLEESKLRLAENMAEVSRHRNRIHQIEASEAARMAELRQLRTRVKDAELALSEARSQEAELRQALDAKEDAIRNLRKKRGYEGHKFKQPASPAAAAPPAEDAELRLRQRIDKLSELAKPIHLDEDEVTMPADAIVEKLTEAERQTQELEADLQKLQADWSNTPESGNTEPTPSADNVILLPNRTRDLKTGTSSPS